MAGKINPVMPEAVTQAALRVMANDQAITLAVGLGQLELNHLLPLITHSLLESLTLLTASCRGLAGDCVDGIEARPGQCLRQVEHSAALATVLVPALGYEAVERIVKEARDQGITVSARIVAAGIASGEAMERLLSPRRLCKLGFTPEEYEEVHRP
jgi:aspartate ammonia-lyase